MFLSRAVAITLLSTILLGCCPVANWVTAFTVNSSSPFLHVPASKVSLSVLFAVQDDERVVSCLERMDEWIVQYSLVSQQAKFDDKIAPTNQKSLNEITSIIETAAFNANGINRDGTPLEESSPLPSVVPPSPSIASTTLVEPKAEPETLAEITNALDRALLGYQDNLSEDELERWVGEIDQLQHKLESQLAALPPASA